MADGLNLQACPFCGAIEHEDHNNDCWFKLREIGASRARLAQAWNRRATPPAPSTAPSDELPHPFEAELTHVERRLSAMWEDAKEEWGNACGGPGEHEIFGMKILSAIRDELALANKKGT